jgi:hypothetical protein
MALSHASINLVTDTIILTVPLVLVLRSRIDIAKKSKWSSNVYQYITTDNMLEFLSIVFAIGGVTVLAAVGRVVSLGFFAYHSRDSEYVI